MSDPNSEAIRSDVQYFEAEVKPVVEEFHEKYGDDILRLVALLDEPDTMDAMLAMKRLGELNAREAVGPLIHMVKDPRETLIAAVAIIVLGQLGDQQAVPTLIEVVESAEERAKQETENMRPSAGLRGVLSGWFGRKWWREIRESTGENVRLIYLRNGISALGKLGDKSATESIRKRLSDPDERVQAAAVEALQRLEAT